MSKKIDLPLWRVDNVYTIIIMAFSIAFTILTFYFSVVGDVREIKQDISYIKSQNDTILEKYVSLENRYGNIALKVQSLETIVGFK